MSLPTYLQTKIPIIQFFNAICEFVSCEFQILFVPLHPLNHYSGIIQTYNFMKPSVELNLLLILLEEYILRTAPGASKSSLT